MSALGQKQTFWSHRNYGCFPALSGHSYPKRTLDGGMSALGWKAVVKQQALERPLVAISGHIHRTSLTTIFASKSYCRVGNPVPIQDGHRAEYSPAYPHA